MAAPVLSLKYFDIRGRVDPVRMMLEHAQLPYTFVGVSWEEWPDVKPEIQKVSPVGQLPVVDFLNPDGTVKSSFAQSSAICRAVARLTKLEGTTEEAQTRVDEICELAQENIIELAKQFWGVNKAEEVLVALQDKLPKFEAYFQKVRTHPLHWVGDSLTVADIYMAFFLEQIPLTFTDFFTQEKFPQLYAFYQATFTTESEGIKNYVRSERRPKIYTVAVAGFAGKPEECVQWK